MGVLDSRWRGNDGRRRGITAGDGVRGDTGFGGNRGRGFRLVGRRLARLVIGLPAPRGILACSARSFPASLPITVALP